MVKIKRVFSRVCNNRVWSHFFNRKYALLSLQDKPKEVWILINTWTTWFLINERIVCVLNTLFRFYFLNFSRHCFCQKQKDWMNMMFTLEVNTLKHINSIFQKNERMITDIWLLNYILILCCYYHLFINVTTLMSLRP